MDNLRRHLLGAGALGAASLLFERGAEAGEPPDPTPVASAPARPPRVTRWRRT